jgi:hypothetical protein
MRSSENSVKATFGEFLFHALGFIRGLPLSVGYMEPLQGRKTLSREGASADND